MKTHNNNNKMIIQESKHKNIQWVIDSDAPKFKLLVETKNRKETKHKNIKRNYYANC